MSDDNLPGESTGPVDDAAMTFTEGVENLSNLLTDPETDPPKEDEDAAADTETEGDEPEIDVTEDVEDEAEAKPEDGPQDDYASGRFAADTAKVKLDDGTVISVAELKRNNLFQRDYTKKTQAHTEAVKAFETQKSEVDQQAQSLKQLAELMTAFGQKYLPKPPEPFDGDAATDPVGYASYLQRRAAYEEAVNELRSVDAERGKLSEAETRKRAEAEAAEQQAEIATLIERDKLFADKAKAAAFFSEVSEKGSEWWGVTPEDIGAIRSHKQILILRDAMEYRKTLAKASEAQKQVSAKPIIARPGRRSDPFVRNSAERAARSERLSKSGSLDDAVAILKDLL